MLFDSLARRFIASKIHLWGNIFYKFSFANLIKHEKLFDKKVFDLYCRASIHTRLPESHMMVSLRSQQLNQSNVGSQVNLLRWLEKKVITIFLGGI